MRGRIYLLVAVAVCWLGTAATAEAATPQVNDCDNPKALAKSHGRAILELDGTRTDIPSWKSTISLDLPTSWPPAKELVNDQGLERKLDPYPCLDEFTYWRFGSFPDPTSSVVVKGQTITVTLTGKENLYYYRGDRRQGFSSYENRIGPWVATANDDSLIISFRTFPFSALRSIAWESFTVKADGFMLTSPEPFPSTQEEDTLVLWEKPSGASNKDNESQLIQVVATPKPITSMKFRISERTGSLAIIPYRAYLLALIIMLMLFLRIERRRRPEGLPESLAATWLLALVGAALVGLDLIDHILGYRFTLHDRVSIIVIACAATVRIGDAPSGAIRQRLAFITVIALAVVAIAFNPTLSPSEDSRDIIFASTLGATCAIYLMWLLLIGAASAILNAPPFDWYKRLPRYRLALLLTAIYLAIYGGLSLIRHFPIMNLTYIVEIANDLIPLLLLLGAVGLLVRGGREDQLLLDRDQRWIIAWLVSFVLLMVSPRYYLSIHVPIVAITGLAITVLVLRVSGNNAILARLTQKQQIPNSLKKLHDSGQQLIVAGERLNSLSAEFKALQKQLSEGAISSAEYSSRRGDLEAEVDGLRRLPPPMRSKLIIRSGVHSTPLPERTNPIDIALSLGPDGNIAKTGMRAGTIGLLLGLLPAGYFSVQSWLPLDQLRLTLAIPDLYLLISFARQLVFWWILSLVLGAAWGSLYGRRGSTRALQVWFCVALPLGIHSGLTWALDQHSEATALFRVTLLLVVLLVVGLSIDLQTLRGYELTQQWDLGLFRRYYKFNRLVATITLIVPLATAGLSLWQQVQSGALRERPPTIRTESVADQQQPEQAAPGSDAGTNDSRP
jgi:hypothetical protein